MFPVFFENSRIPVWLSKIAPINVYAFSFGLWVWCKGVMSERTKRHETIHFRQQLEMMFIFQWLLYGFFHIVGLIKYGDGKKAYYENPFEREAYSNDGNVSYLSERKHFAWVSYIFKSGKR